MAGLFAPPAQLAEFYGLWTFVTRLASIIGPLTYGAITWITDGNQRLAMGSTAVLFLVGLIFLLPVNMARGRAAALATVPASASSS
jgi:UMF1 family MFS transporter